MHTEAVLDFLYRIYEQIDAEEKAQQKNRLYHADRFNPFDFLKNDENGLSNILKFLLNPNESHGQGRLILDSFLNHFGLQRFLAYDSADLLTEKTVSGSRRRHDIWIEGRLGQQQQWIVSIENKLRGAPDQHNQVADYLADLHKHNPHCHLIYLAPTESDPSSFSIDQNAWVHSKQAQQASVISARQLALWLEQVPVVAPNVRQFIAFFKQYLENNIMGQSENSETLAKEIIKSTETLSAALQILGSKDDIYSLLTEKLINQLRRKCQDYEDLIEQGWTVDCPAQNPGEKGFYFGFHAPGEQYWPLAVCFEFGARNSKQGFVGIYANVEILTPQQWQSITDIARTNLEAFGAEEADDGWILWKYADHDLKAWGDEQWLQILNGELADKIFKQWQPLIELVRESK